MEGCWRALKAGGNGYLNKESDLKEIENALDQVAIGNNYVNAKYAGSLLHKVVKGPSVSIENLSEREFQVMRLLAEGSSNSEIADILGISINSLSTYRSRILKKLNIKSTVDIVRYAFRKRIVYLGQ